MNFSNTPRLPITVHPVRNINADLDIPGDKSISHRSVILGSLAQGETRIINFLESEDCLNTIECFKKMGISINSSKDKKELTIIGKGLYGLSAPRETLYVGNSGTAIRLMLGILAAQKFDSVITGDASICTRPMGRVIKPLQLMGANILALNEDKSLLAPLKVLGNQKVKGITYEMPMASAQVKSAIMLAGLYTPEKTVIVEPGPARDHSERMLRQFGVDVNVSHNVIELTGGRELSSQDIKVPSDISSAAFFIVAALIVPGSKIVLPRIGINPTRTGILDVLQEMGAKITLHNIDRSSCEPVADIEVVSSQLKGINIEGSVIPRIIDEIPIIAVAAAVAEGKTVISGAEELRYKESDRIATICKELTKFGTHIVEKEDGLIIEGARDDLKGAVCKSHGDHRIAMSCAILALVSKGNSCIEDVDCINTSFPRFFPLFERLLEFNY
ncbi:MAG: 3-phosphoshikimate 1-carboxyvinyltransferase [Candidatus Margulisiibacteriota bacterium]|nr:MAG: 3-phosphoshikimate 1-carboxyvinyltransferase [Candidatus Margulisbacteria bacterium GWD2_39_127]OGI06043.1 MAG: 3-phosphoshikimate 1-carboxyvinyltransferase [Candidatus Margulisbacteria bacterium GWE2_39_32]PZM77317.1 MAG: 3-phosphoshikimate 1-carboxyvinyltransferase [Candidatus Margulisiibacteriota bacterium]HAR62567.1 3-phosphoshikimate 1-carboxyvinyltransferase [Candidatus Margulisiibacteriota bacterium]HCY37731.1 3-phosphoshikimate 1-carboxyvinyltransferase [Candidatus Margulisiibac